MKRLLALFAVASLALPVQAQFNPVTPDVPDSLYIEGDFFVGAENLFNWTEPTAAYRDHLEADPCESTPFVGDKWIKFDTLRIVGYQHRDLRSNDTDLGKKFQSPKSFVYGNHRHEVLRFTVIEVGSEQRIRFALSGSNNMETEEHRLRLLRNSFLVVKGDTLHLRDGRTNTDFRDCGTDYTQWGMYFYFRGTDISLVEDEVVPFEFWSNISIGKAELPEQELEVRRQRHQGKPVAENLWISWYLPGNPTYAHLQREYERDLYPHYEYQLLRVGDLEWKAFTVSQTQLDRVDVFRTIFGLINLQRRKFLITGLDPGKEYSICLRMVNTIGSSHERCNLNTFRPVSTEPSELPTSTQLHQNYPNPFNPSTAIRYELPAAEHVRLDVFDVSGRNVKVLVDGTRPAGTHTARFDAGGLPSGLYVYRLQAGGNTIVKTMHLIR